MTVPAKALTFADRWRGVMHRVGFWRQVWPRRFQLWLNGWRKLPQLSSGDWGWWFFEQKMLVLDLLGFGVGYEILTTGLKWRTRALSPEEKALLQTVYADSVKYHLIRIDERARLGTRKGRICYVSGHTINSWGHMPPELLVHEIIHIWQYERIGLAYIPRALRAQRSRAGYNYGGVEQLRHLRKRGATLWDLNLEQQGDLVADYYSLREGLAPRWVPQNVSAQEEFPYWIAQIAESAEVVA